MGFTFDDFIQVSRSMNRVEHFCSEVASVEKMTHEQVIEMFPGVKLAQSKSVVYFPMKMCHSLPSVNLRGRCFTPQTLANSFASAVDSVIDREHSLVGNDIGVTNDSIIGHIKAARFDKSGLAAISEMASSGTSIPSEAIPLYALGALHLRAAGVPEMIEEHITGKRKWSVSMECGHEWASAAFLYRGEFIPAKDAPGQMLECVKKHCVDKYKGHELAAVLGGVNGMVEFWGLGMTTSPADSKGDVISFVAGQSQEVASRKIFSMPMYFERLGTASELASKNFSEIIPEVVDRKIKELGSLEIIGESSPSELDGHTHLILSDMTVMPSPMGGGSHDHYLSSSTISRGTNPKITARLSTHTTYNRVEGSGDSVACCHMHLVGIDLKGKYKAGLSTGKSEESESEEANVLPIINGDLSMKVSDLLVKMEGMSTALASFAKATNDAERTKASNDLLSLSSDIKEMASKGSIEAEYASRIEADIKLGKLVTKEVADKAVEEAKKAAEDKFNAELAESKIRQDRIAKLAENDIDPATEYNDILSADGKTPMTIAIHLAEIGVDAKGEREFQMQLNLWKAVAEKNKVTPAAESVAAAAAAGVTSASAANTGKVSTGKKTILSAVGGTNDHADQVPADIASQPKRLQGKYSFSK